MRARNRNEGTIHHTIQLAMRDEIQKAARRGEPRASIVQRYAGHGIHRPTLSQWIDHATVPFIQVVSGRVLANSQNIAPFFGKLHADVVRDVQTLIATDPACRGWFVKRSPALSHPNGGAPSEPSYDMDRSGFALLVTSFFRPADMQWVRSYLEAFETVHSDHLLALQIRTDLEHPTQKIGAPRMEKSRIALEQEKPAQVIEKRPTTKFYGDSAAFIDGLFTLHNAARVLRQPMQVFINYLVANRYLLVKSSVHVPSPDWIDEGMFVFHSTAQQIYLTQLGTQYLAVQLHVPLDPQLFAISPPVKGRGALLM
jgi:Rha family phage regulatory protein